jgi:tetratricopeptide (TPR) repeat protein
MNIRLNACIGLLLAMSSTLAQAQVSAQACGSLQNHIGPWDYRTKGGPDVPLVENAHFTLPVEMAMRGERGYLGQDLDYTLRATPNHHRALVALQRYEARLKYIASHERLPRPVECYYERAVRWKPDDALARMLYAQFLYGKGRAAEATAQLQIAKDLSGDNAMTQYNIGLVYLEGKDYALAREQARRAMELGFERATLRERLAALGQWEPAVAPAEAASAAVPR